MAAAVLHADRPTDGLTDMTKLIGALTDYTSAPNNRFFGRHYKLAYVSVNIGLENRVNRSFQILR
jgi:hypothetical protein